MLQSLCELHKIPDKLQPKFVDVDMKVTGLFHTIHIFVILPYIVTENQQLNLMPPELHEMIILIQA
jgi:hypothetical protein